MPKISIIVPVYKVEKYLRRCLDSIVNQTFTDWECILVDDGSPDNSGKICDEYAEKDRRFRVFHQVNTGVSAARNKGLDEARGEWISFVDSDDWIEDNALESLTEKMSDYHLIIGGIMHVQGSSTIEQRFTSQNINLTFFINLLFVSSNYGYLGYLFPKLYDSKIIQRNNLRFNEKIYYNEDRLFLLQYVLNCKKIFFEDKILYNYFMRDDSAMGKKKNSFSEKMITELIAYDAMLNLLSKYNYNCYLNCGINAFYDACILESNCDEQNYKIINQYKKRFYSIAKKTNDVITRLKMYKANFSSFIKRRLYK